MTTPRSVLLRSTVGEFFAVTLWVSVSHALFFLTTSNALHHVHPIVRDIHPTTFFLALLFLLMGCFELFGLFFNSPLNPVLTFAMLLSGQLPLCKAIPMILSQFFGHAAGVSLVGFLNAYTLSHPPEKVFAPPQPHPESTLWHAVLVEAIITAIFCVSALSMDNLFDKRSYFRRWIFITSLTVAVIAVADPWTGACMNPAMSFALSYHHQTWDNQIVYWVGPLTGAFAALFAYVWVIPIISRQCTLLLKEKKRWPLSYVHNLHFTASLIK